MARKFICNTCGKAFEADSMPDKCPFCQAESSHIEEETNNANVKEAPRKKGIDTNSNSYTIVYAAVMVIVVAFMLAFVSSALKPTQDANVLRDTKNQMLTSLNIEGLSGEAIDAKYAEVVTDTLQSGDKVYYKANVDGEVKYIFPLAGRGLWGGLSGYISLNEDCRCVYGAYFNHESETAGLGARIKERWFQLQFNGKPVFDENGNVALTVTKAGAAKAETDVNGVTGATLTCHGVAAMVHDGLDSYKDVIASNPAAAGEQAEEAPAEADTTVVEQN